MGKTRRIDNREFEDHQSPRKSKYRRKKKRSKVTDATLDPEFESDGERRWTEEYEELNPEIENIKGN